MTALPEPQSGRIRELDGVRGIAILLVLVWHYLVCQVGAPPPLFRFLMATWSGVDLFFVLSGALLRGRLPIGTANGWLFDDPLPLWSYATFTQNFLMSKWGTFGPNWLAPTWSLAIEEQFYLLLTIVIR